MSALLRRPEVERRTGLARSTLYRDIAAGIFPRPVRIGPGTVGWVEAEVDAWVDARIGASESRTPLPRGGSGIRGGCTEKVAT